jgi:phosphatidylglycerol:prolipoprotein diacylglycerol transferase
MNVEGIFHHPTFLYESVWNFVGLLLLLLLRRRKFLRAGELFCSYFIWYSIGRFFIEALRTDSLAFQGADWLASFINGLWAPMTWLGFEQGYLAPSYGNIRISQLLSLLIVVVAILFIIVRRITISDLPHYLDPVVSTKANEVDGWAAQAVKAASEQDSEMTSVKEARTPSEPESMENKKE